MIAVIIINYKSEERTVKFVKEEISRISSEHKVIIIDNSSSESSLRTLREFLPEAVILPSKENLGFAKANNLGADYAFKHFKTDYLLFSNNDIHLNDSNVVQALCEKADMSEDISIIGPKVIGPDGQLQSPSPFESFANRHILLYLSHLYMGKKNRIKRLKLDYKEQAKEGYHYLVSGCFFLVKSRAYKDCGGMDPHTFLYAEEMILAERMKSIGGQCYYLPSTSVIHEHGSTISKNFIYKKRRKMAFDSECYFYRKYIHTPLWQIAVARIILYLKLLFM